MTKQVSDHLGLGIRIVVHIRPGSTCEGTFEFCVSCAVSRIDTQPIAKVEIVPHGLMLRLVHVDVHVPLGRSEHPVLWLSYAQIEALVRHGGRVRRLVIHVPECQQHVDDRFRCEPWHRSATDVLDRDGEGAYRRPYLITQAREAQRPLRVIVHHDDVDRFATADKDGVQFGVAICRHPATITRRVPLNRRSYPVRGNGTFHQLDGHTPGVANVASEITSVNGGIFRKIGKLAPSRAAELVREPTTLVAWDACACGGYCGYEWLTDTQVRSLDDAGNPRIKAIKNTLQHALYEYRAADDRALVLAVGGVHWGGLLADRPRR